MPAATDRYYTRAEVLAFPDDGNRYELVYGELLVSPAPVARHQRVVLRLWEPLNAYVQRERLGEALISPADISWGREHDVIAQPDVFVVAPSDAGKADWHDMRNFLLFAEVLSPSTARHDRFTKRRLYQDMHVPLYWILDIERGRAEVWTPEATEARIETRHVTWHPSGASAPLVLDLEPLLAP